MEGKLNYKLKSISKKCVDVSEKLEACLSFDLDDINTYYPIYKNLESATSDFGTVIFDMEYEARESKAMDSPEFNVDSLSKKEKNELARYISRYCGDNWDNKYSFVRFNKGYKATLPYLLDRRANKGIYFSPKKKFISNVFEMLLKNNEDIIQRFNRATIIIVSLSPFGNSLVRDNDNADSRDIINLVNKYLMATDDSGAYLNIMYETKESDDYKTEVYIIPPISFTQLVS